MSGKFEHGGPNVAREAMPADVLLASRYEDAYTRIGGGYGSIDFNGPCCLFAVVDEGSAVMVERFVNDGAGGYFTPYPSANAQAAMTFEQPMCVLQFAGRYRLTIAESAAQTTVVNRWVQDPMPRP